jgi:hypothetical protein
MAVGYGAYRLAQHTATAVASGQGMMGSMMGAVPVIGGFLSAAYGNAENMYGQYAGAEAAQAGAFGQTGIGGFGSGQSGRGLAKKAQRFGISQAELPGVLSGIAGSSGLRGDELNTFAGEGMRQQKMLGVDAGGIARGAGLAGGNMTGSKAIELTQKAIGLGVATGISDANLPGYLEEMAGDISSLRTRGFQIDPTGVAQLAQVFAGTQEASLQGEAGVAAAKTMTEKLRTAASGTDAFSAFAFNAARQITGSTAEAIAALEQTPEKVMYKLAENLQAVGGTSEGGIAAFLKNAGAVDSFSQGLAIERTIRSGNFEKAAAQMQGSEFGALGEDTLANRESQAKREGTFGESQFTAGQTNLDIGGGATVAKDIRATHDIGRRLGMKIAPASAKLAAKGARVIEGFVNGGVAGGVRQFGNEFGVHLPDIDPNKPRQEGNAPGDPGGTGNAPGQEGAGAGTNLLRDLGAGRNMAGKDAAAAYEAFSKFVVDVGVFQKRLDAVLLSIENFVHHIPLMGG